jgi:hypothetical protein
MKLCITCEHYRAGENRRRICKEARNRFFDPVTGTYIDYDCTWLRSRLHEEDGCGPHGRWWKPKNNEANPYRPPQSGEKAPSAAPAPNMRAAGKAKGWRDWIKALGRWPKGRDTRWRPF